MASAARSRSRWPASRWRAAFWSRSISSLSCRCRSRAAVTAAGSFSPPPYAYGLNGRASLALAMADCPPPPSSGVTGRHDSVPLVCDSPIVIPQLLVPLRDLDPADAGAVPVAGPDNPAEHVPGEGLELGDPGHHGLLRLSEILSHRPRPPAPPRAAGRWRAARRGRPGLPCTGRAVP